MNNPKPARRPFMGESLERRDLLTGNVLLESTLHLDLDLGQVLLVGDVNNDERADVILGPPSGWDIGQVLLGNEDGTFSKRSEISNTPSSSRDARMADFNNDGDVDLILTKNSQPGTVLLVRGHGDGTFSDDSSVETDGQLLDVADVNDDGNVDLIFRFFQPETNERGISMLFGDDTGEFFTRPAQTIMLNSEPSTIVVDDIDGDGITDLLVEQCNLDSGTNNKLLLLTGNGDSTFAAPERYGRAPTNCGVLISADLNGDGTPDIVAAEENADAVWASTQNGNSFARVYEDDLSAVHVADFTGDGNLDIGGISDFQWIVLPGNGQGDWGTPIRSLLPRETHAFFDVVDFNNDGQLDLVGKGFDRIVSVSLGHGDGRFGAEFTTLRTTAAQRTESFDINADGVDDLLWTQPTTNQVGIRLGRATGGFQAQQYLEFGPQPTSLAFGDFNADGWTDIAATLGAANPAEDQPGVAVRWGQAGNTFAPAEVFEVAGNPLQSLVGDYDSDGVTDLLIKYRDTNRVSVHLGSPELGLAQRIDTDLPNDWHVFAAATSADFDLDGHLDLAIAAGSDPIPFEFTSAVSVLRGNGDGSFGLPSAFPVGYRIHNDIAAADLNGDGAQDLITVHETQISVLPGDGLGGFDDFQSYGLDCSDGERGDGLTIADFNQDEWPDVAACGTVFFGQQQPSPLTFAGTDQLPVISYQLDVGDFNADGQLDGAITLSDGIIVVYGEQPPRTGDINADGIVDFADFLILSQNFGKINAMPNDGDLNSDQTIGFADFLILSANFDL